MASDLMPSQMPALCGRYWLADTYEARHAAGQEPQSIDKEFLRLWFRANCDPYGDAVRLRCRPSRAELTLGRVDCSLLLARVCDIGVPAAGLQELPAAPDELVVELARRYVLLYETITGERFEPAPGGAGRAQGMAASTRAALDAL